MQLSYVRLLLQDGASLPRRQVVVKEFRLVFCDNDSLIWHG
jgi:hypothetical protein